MDEDLLLKKVKQLVTETKQLKDELVDFENKQGSELAQLKKIIFTLESCHALIKVTDLLTPPMCTKPELIDFSSTHLPKFLQELNALIASFGTEISSREQAYRASENRLNQLYSLFGLVKPHSPTNTVILGEDEKEDEEEPPPPPPVIIVAPSQVIADVPIVEPVVTSMPPPPVEVVIPPPPPVEKPIEEPPKPIEHPIARKPSITPLLGPSPSRPGSVEPLTTPSNTRHVDQPEEVPLINDYDSVNGWHSEDEVEKEPTTFMDVLRRGQQSMAMTQRQADIQSVNTFRKSLSTASLGSIHLDAPPVEEHENEHEIEMPPPPMEAVPEAQPVAYEQLMNWQVPSFEDIVGDPENYFEPNIPPPTRKRKTPSANSSQTKKPRANSRAKSNGAPKPVLGALLPSPDFDPNKRFKFESSSQIWAMDKGNEPSRMRELFQGFLWKLVTEEKRQSPQPNKPGPLEERWKYIYSRKKPFLEAFPDPLVFEGKTGSEIFRLLLEKFPKQ